MSRLIRLLVGVALAVISIVAIVQVSNAHSGGTNSDGCHRNHKTGDYHCH